MNSLKFKAAILFLTAQMVAARVYRWDPNSRVTGIVFANSANDDRASIFLNIHNNGPDLWVPFFQVLAKLERSDRSSASLMEAHFKLSDSQYDQLKAHLDFLISEESRGASMCDEILQSPLRSVLNCGYLIEREPGTSVRIQYINGGIEAVWANNGTDTACFNLEVNKVFYCRVTLTADKIQAPAA